MLSNQAHEHPWQEALHDLEEPPTTEAGRWSAALLIAMLLAVSLFGVGVGYGVRSSDDVFGNPYLVATIIGAAVLATAAGIAGAIALAFEHERSWLAVTSLAVGIGTLIAVGAGLL